MTVPIVYNIGKAQVANGSKNVAGQGTSWLVLRPGYTFRRFGLDVTIETITDNENLVLSEPWTGAALDFDDIVDGSVDNPNYQIVPANDPTYYSETTRRLLERMNAFIASGRGLYFKWSTTTTDADPGSGKVQANNAALSLVEEIYISDNDYNGGDVSGLLASIAAVPSTPHAQLVLRSINRPSVWAIFNFSGSATAGSGYTKLTGLGHLDGDGTFAADEEVSFSWAESGSPGHTSGARFTFSTTTSDADPGDGRIRFNNGTVASVTMLYIDNETADGLNITGWLDSLDDVNNTNSRGDLWLQVDSDPSVFVHFSVTGVVTDGTGYRKVPVAYVQGVLPANGDILGAAFMRAGRDGRAPGVARFAFDVTTGDADPGAGKIRFNHGTFASITYLYVDNLDADGNTITTFLDSLDDAVNGVNRGIIQLQADGNATSAASFAVAGAVVDGTGYRKIPVTPLNGSVPADATVLAMSFARSGADARGAGQRLTFSTTTTDADPGAGQFRADNATFGSIGWLYIDNVDALGNSTTALLDALNNIVSSDGRGTISFMGDGANVGMVFEISGLVVDGTGYRKVPVSPISGIIPANGAGLAMSIAKYGSNARAVGVRLTYDDTTTDSDPGTGKVRANNATFLSVTELYIDNVDNDSSDITTLLDSLDDVENAGIRGFLRFQADGENTNFAEFAVMGAIVDGTGYRKIPVEPRVGSWPATGSQVAMTFSRAGENSRAPGIRLHFDDSTVDADPGDGFFRADDAVEEDIRWLYISDEDVDGFSTTNFIALFDDVENASHRGVLQFTGDGSTPDIITFIITDAVTIETGYFKVPVLCVSGALPAAGTHLNLSFMTSGRDGTNGFTPGFQFTLDGTSQADSDPGSGLFRFNNVTLSSVTELYFDNLDKSGTDVTAWIDSFDDPSGLSKGQLRIQVSDDPAKYVLFLVNGAIVDGTGYRKVPVEYVVGTSFADTDIVSVSFLPYGADGLDGVASGIPYVFDAASQADSDPGGFNFRINDTVPADATFIYFADDDANGADVSAFMLTWGDSTNAVKGSVLIRKLSDPTVFYLYEISGASVDATGYVKVPVLWVTGNGSLGDDDDATIEFTRYGDSGVTSVNGETGTVVLTTDDISDSGQTNKWATAAEKTKLGYITVTQAVDLDAIETRVNALDAAVVLQGSWDASAGTFPGGGTAQAGDSWVVSVAGTVDGVAFNIGDRVLALTDNASTTTYASNWLIEDYTDRVSTVAGKTGTVTLQVADITDMSADARTFNAAANYAAMRTALGVAIGSDVQAYDADLATIAGLTATTDNFIVSVSSAWASRTPAQVKTTLGLSTADSPEFTAINIGHASDTTVARVSAGILSVEGVNLLRGTVGATDNAVPRADGTDTTKLQASGVIIDDSNNVSGVVALTATGVLTLKVTTGGAAVPTAVTDTILHLAGTDATSPYQLNDAFGGTPWLAFRRANGTIASKTALALNDNLGGIDFRGYEATNGYSGAQAWIRARATEAWTGTAHGTKLDLAVTPNGSTTSTVGLTVENDGSVSVVYGQLGFPAAHNPSTDANALDDYEEGSWTPALKFGGASVSMTYTDQSGVYNKIGKHTTTWWRHLLNDSGTSTGNATITGLPFTSTTSIGLNLAVIAYSSSATVTNAAIASGATSISLYNGTTTSTHTALPDGANYGGAGIYQASA